MPSKKHLHTLMRASHKTRKDLFVCRDPECSFRANKIYVEYKRFICPFCGRPYIIDPALIQLKIPHCHDCTRGRKKTPKLDIISLVVEEAKK